MSGGRARLVGVWILVAVGLLGCRSVRTDEALVMLDVSPAAGMPPFTSARFSVAGRPEIAPHEVPYQGATPLQFGYYLPGPNGTLRITGQALSASCLVGTGSVAVEVQVGRVSAPVSLVITALTDVDPACLASRDASADGPAVRDAGQDAPRDAGASDAHTALDAAVDRSVPPPACMAATTACPGASACCSGLVCGTTSLGSVCCGNFNMTCSRPGGEDCCGQLECVSGHCCLPATYPCSNSSCCPGLVCGTTSLGHVCCGNAGAACKRTDGADCCGSLECVNGKCQ